MTESPKSRFDIPPVWFLAAIALMVALDQGLPFAEWLAGPWRWFGAVPACAGIALAIWAERLFERAGTGVKPFTPTTALVAEGPYRFSRNPMYLGMILVLIGLAMALGSLTPILVVPLFAWLLQTRFILREEDHMEQHQGDDYLAYKSRTRRWL